MQGAKYALRSRTVRVAITVALQAAGIGFGDEVIVPAYTWDGTAAAAFARRHVPVFADVDPDTYCLDVEAVRETITARTKVIVPCTSRCASPKWTRWSSSRKNMD